MATCMAGRVTLFICHTTEARWRRAVIKYLYRNKIAQNCKNSGVSMTIKNTGCSERALWFAKNMLMSIIIHQLTAKYNKSQQNTALPIPLLHVTIDRHRLDNVSLYGHCSLSNQLWSLSSFSSSSKMLYRLDFTIGLSTCCCRWWTNLNKLIGFYIHYSSVFYWTKANSCDHRARWGSVC